MKTADFDYDLPPEFIAQRPVTPRDSARLLEVATSLRDFRVTDLPELLRPGDILVVNDTKVIPARLVGRRGESRVEVTLIRCESPEVWQALARPARKLRPDDEISFDEGLSARVAAHGENGQVTLTFDRGAEALTAVLDRIGAMPLPPYIKRPNLADDRDRGDYQTMFAARAGAVASPTAGLHFTPRVTQALAERGVRTVALTLHVGAGTFLPVKTNDVANHKMHAEWGEIRAETAAAINSARSRGGQVVAVGTTSLRLLETAAAKDGDLRPFLGETELFVTPGYRFKVVDRLLTNFHLPRSTLFMLVCAFAGTARMKAAYEHAKRAGYRFYSYGDCCLLSWSTDG